MDWTVDCIDVDLNCACTVVRVFLPRDSSCKVVCVSKSGISRWIQGRVVSVLAAFL